MFKRLDAKGAKSIICEKGRRKFQKDKIHQNISGKNLNTKKGIL